MATYEVWATNDLSEWTQCLLETEDKEEAFQKAQSVFDARRFKWIAVDRDGKTIWSNDPDTPPEAS